LVTDAADGADGIFLNCPHRNHSGSFKLLNSLAILTSNTVSTVGGSETGPADQTGPTKPGRRFSWISTAAREGFVLAPEAWSPTLLMVLTEPHRS
jgi:hypothetical protein